MFKKLRERKILREMKKYTEIYFSTRNKFNQTMTAIRLNGLCSDCANLLLKDKISFDFYETYFIDKKINMYNQWWEVKKDIILR